MDDMSVLTVISSISRGGAEKVAVDLSNAWAARGARVDIVTITDSTNPLPLAPAVRLTSLNQSNDPASAFVRAFRNIVTVLRLRGTIRQMRPLVVVSHVDRTNVVAVLAAWGLNIPVIIVEHNHPTLHPIGGLWRALRTLTYPRAQYIVGVSKGVVASLPDGWRSRAIAIPNSIQAASTTASPAIGAKRVVAMGRLDRQKGFDVLIRAFAEVLAVHVDATLTIWGHGEEEESLRALAAEAGIAKAIHFPGRTDSPAAALCQGSLFVFPSRYEGFGLALAEAMALGLPVIATDCPCGPAEIVCNGVDGLLVPPENSSILASAINRVLSDPELAAQLGAEGRGIFEKFSFEKSLASWDHLLGSAVANQRAGS